ncbi:MAG: hypothetical protein K1X74_16730 [Pirellulales bacterium]|nr:hypothetical protein [Pirellulales bacterium]
MHSPGALRVAIFVHKARGQWIVKDPEGAFWIVPSGEHSWQRREPFDPSGAEVDLEPVPGHYKYLLEIPF